MNNNTQAIFRSVIENSDTTGKIHKYRNTMRPPGNVPFVVDNLWEWKRPKGFPNRRFSVYASPQANLAKESGHDQGSVFRVGLEGRYKLCQVIGINDSKYHPDCKNLRKLLFKLFGQEWIDGKLADKEGFGKLWIPCLTKKEIYSIFSRGKD